MTERRYITLLAVGMLAWAGLAYMILSQAPRTNDPTDCRELAKHEQAKCKARRKL